MQNTLPKTWTEAQRYHCPPVAIKAAQLAVRTHREPASIFLTETRERVASEIEVSYAPSGKPLSMREILSDGTVYTESYFLKEGGAN